MKSFGDKIFVFYKKIRLSPDPDVFTALFIVAIFSLGLGIYNNYQIRNGVVAPRNVVNGQKVLPAKNLIRNINVDAPTIGNVNAKITMVIFEDFQCPFCKKFHDESFDQLKREFVDTGKIKVVHQNLAFLGIESINTAQAASCAKDQKKFWEYVDLIYANQGRENSGNLSDDNLKKLAKNLGLGMTKFEACYDSQKYKSLVENEKAFAKSYGITSTPTLVINGEIIKGAKSFDALKVIIDNKLK